MLSVLLNEALAIRKGLAGSCDKNVGGWLLPWVWSGTKRSIPFSKTFLSLFLPMLHPQRWSTCWQSVQHSRVCCPWATLHGDLLSSPQSCREGHPAAWADHKTGPKGKRFQHPDSSVISFRRWIVRINCLTEYFIFFFLLFSGMKPNEALWRFSIGEKHKSCHTSVCISDEVVSTNIEFCYFSTLDFSTLTFFNSFWCLWTFPICL